MSRPVRCDQCNEPTSDRVGYIVYNIHVRSEGDAPHRSQLDHDFCGIECLAAWATDQVAHKNQGMHLT